MRIEQKKREAINRYILEKISEGRQDLASAVAGEFDMNPGSVYQFLKRMKEDGTIVRKKRGAYELCEQSNIIKFSRSAGEMEDETQIVKSIFQGKMDSLPDNVRTMWSYIASEMLNNAIEHSGAEHLNVRIEQNALLTRLVVEDDGIGIFRKIMGHFGMHNPEDAICELFKGKLTTDPSHHSGEGIFFSSRMADRFIIRSEGHIFAVNRLDQDELAPEKDEKPGTKVIMELSNASNKTAAEIFDRFAEVDGGFRKTKLPLKNMFDSAPVSRSQAKRICHRLDNFGEVILDFEGLSWMGQGFAHQIFVVFQGEHPSMIIRAENMNRDVEMMYNHVLNGKTGISN